MKQRGRGERYQRVRQMEKRQYPRLGEEERRVSTGAQEDQGEPRRVREWRSGSRLWPALGEGYLRKERHKTGQQQYGRVYAPGRNEAATTERSVGRKRVLGVLGRPRKERKHGGADEEAVLQSGSRVWERVDRERIRSYRGQEGRRAPGQRPGRREWKRRRRRRERARNLYEHSTRRRVGEGGRKYWCTQVGSDPLREEIKVGGEAMLGDYVEDAGEQRQWYGEELQGRRPRVEEAPRLRESGEVQQRRRRAQETLEGGRSQGQRRVGEVAVYR